MIKRLFLTIGLLCLLVGMTTAQNAGASWTILYFGNADNDLEAALMGDFYEMQLVGSNQDVNIVVQFDRAEGYDESNGNWTDTRRYYVEQRPDVNKPTERNALIEFMAQALVSQGFSYEETVAELQPRTDQEINNIYEYFGLGRLIDQTPLENLGEADMGDEETLYDFLVWGASNYPAEKYMVNISTHGGGWEGLGPDEASNGTLELRELDSAFGRAREALGIDKFDIVAFDACLMSQLEVALMLVPHADFMLAAEEVIPSDGYAYEPTLNALKANPDWDAFQLGAAFIDTYIEYYAENNRRQIDLQLIELDKIGAVVASLETFQQAVAADSEAVLSSLATARINAQVFGTSSSDNGELRASTDLYDFMRILSGQANITDAVYSASLEVMASIESAVAYRQTDEFLTRAYGLAIYLPLTDLLYEAGSPGYTDQITAEAQIWLDFLVNFYTTANTVLADNNLTVAISNVLTVSGNPSYHDIPVVNIDSDGRGVVNMEAFVTRLFESGEQLIVDTTPLVLQTVLPDGEVVTEYPEGEFKIEYAWLPEVPVVTDGTNSAYGAIQFSAGSSRFGLYQGQLIRGEEAIAASLVFDISTQRLEKIVATRETENGSVPFETPVVAGDVFVPFVNYYDVDGAYQTILSDVVLDLNSAEGVSYSYQVAPTSTYRVVFILTDLRGEIAFDAAIIDVNNEGIDTSLKGYTELAWGVSFLYPSTWAAPDQLLNEDGSVDVRVFSPDFDNSFYMTAYTEITDVESVLQFAQDRLANFEATLTESPTLGEFEGNSYYYIDYTYPSEEGERVGTLLALLNPDTSMGYIFDFNSSTSESLNALFSAISPTFRYFPPVVE